MEGVGSVLKSVPYIGEGLEKIKSKNWAEPLGVGLQITGEIFELAGEAGVPVIGLIGIATLHNSVLVSNSCNNILSIRNLPQGWL